MDPIRPFVRRSVILDGQIVVSRRPATSGARHTAAASHVGIASISEENGMQSASISAVIIAIALTLATGTADAADRRQGRASAAPPQASMTEQLNAESLQRARQGQNSPTPGPDTTSNLNRMSEEDAARGQAMPRPPMPFR